ncbi:AMP-binding protein [Arsukibacterium sp.]|uniref:AMP-binding protein n=1 Tax=Arsukibacterium sp. TaxID=1977258 RepID=UPI001BD26536|nr:AMP-binding protein [Arsukibacterium sp.]
MAACLLELIQQHPGAAIALQYCDPADGSVIKISYQQLTTAAQLKRQQISQQQRYNVTLPYHQFTDFIVGLLAYDGVCAALYLLPDQQIELPAEQSRSTRPAAAKQSAVDSRWYLATSGTTGTPKWIGHSLAQLTKTVNTKASSSQLCWGLVYQPFRFAGLQVVLQSLLSGACLIDASDGDIEQRLDMLVQAGVTALSATPSLWRQFLFSSKVTALHLQQLTLGGEIVDQPLLNRLKQLFPQAQLRHIYASTEAGVAFAVSDGQAGFPRRYLTRAIMICSLRLISNSTYG